MTRDQQFVGSFDPQHFDSYQFSRDDDGVPSATAERVEWLQPGERPAILIEVAAVASHALNGPPGLGALHNRPVRKMLVFDGDARETVDSVLLESSQYVPWKRETVPCQPIVGAGLKQGIEVFPKQDRLEDGEYGNAIRAPLGVHRKSNRRYWFYEAAPGPEAQIEYIRGIKRLTEGELHTFIEGMTLPEAYLPPKREPYIPPVLPAGYREFRILEYVQVNTRVRDPKNWVARCPSCASAGRDRHGDNLKILKSNPLVYKCFAGCRKEDIREALGRPIRHRHTA